MSYLDIDAILRAAKDSGCDAIFPGYGFLAENPDFADAVKREKMTFIGPSARVMRVMGDKIQARKALSASGVPVTPALEDVDDPEKVIRFGNRVGWPILVKAAGGGGGKGMQKVSSPAEVEESLARRAPSRRRRSEGDDLRREIHRARPPHRVPVPADRYRTSSTSASANAPSSGGTRSWSRRRRAPC
jgi:acetyl/propionyl-CoA carboxylase alpha subunit